MRRSFKASPGYQDEGAAWEGYNRSMTPRLLAFFIAAALMPCSAQSFDPAKPDWTKINDEAMRHYQALVRIDTTDPPGNETRAVEYLAACSKPKAFR